MKKRKEGMNEGAKGEKVKKDQKRGECGVGIEINIKSLVDKD